MATINGKSGFAQRGVYRSVWTPLGNADSGTPEELAGLPYKSVQFAGTFGGATAVLEGSDDGVTYFTLVGASPTGGADVLISTTSAQRFDFLDVPNFIRPRTSGGAGTSLTVTVTSKANGTI